MSVYPFSPTAGPDNTSGNSGVFFNNIDVKVKNRITAGITKGDLVMLDLAASDGDVSDLSTYGNEDSPFANVIVPSAAAIAGNLPCVVGVALEDISNDAVGSIRIFGVVDEASIKASTPASVTYGQALVAETDATMNFTATTGDVVIGWLLDADYSATGTASLKKVFITGIQLQGITAA